MTNLKTRIAILFAGLGALYVVAAAMGAWGVSISDRRARDDYQEITPSTQYLKEAYRFQLLAALALREAVASDVDLAAQEERGIR